VTDADAADELARLTGLARRAGEALRARSLRLATAESCTGGLIGHVLTEIPGSSDYYLGGLISYSDALKRAELGVDERVLEHHGAVSAQTCVAMAEGARRRYGASIALAVTGIAGPSGGSAAKPVGLTYVAVADESGHQVQRHQWSGDRHSNKVASASAALVLLLEHLSATAGDAT
jgi:PncC family amidohydrolase